MMAMMGFMMVFVMAVPLLALVYMLGMVRNTDGKAKRTEELEKPKRYHLALGDDGEFVEVYEDEASLLYAGEEQ